MAKDIVLATDGSAYSLEAARYIVKSGLLPDGGVVRVLHVMANLPARVSRFVDAGAIQDWYGEESAKVLDPTADVLRQAGVPHVVESRIGFAPQEITRYADEVDAHMIVMGSHGRGVLLDAVIGSVAGRVLALTHRPVLLIQHPGDAPDQTR
jgi:nucleotide-binding universal stress UspA family protein